MFECVPVIATHINLSDSLSRRRLMSSSMWRACVRYLQFVQRWNSISDSAYSTFMSRLNWLQQKKSYKKMSRFSTALIFAIVHRSTSSWFCHCYWLMLEIVACLHVHLAHTPPDGCAPKTKKLQRGQCGRTAASIIGYADSRLLGGVNRSISERDVIAWLVLSWMRRRTYKTSENLQHPIRCVTPLFGTKKCPHLKRHNQNGHESHVSCLRNRQACILRMFRNGFVNRDATGKSQC